MEYTSADYRGSNIQVEPVVEEPAIEQYSGYGGEGKSGYGGEGESGYGGESEPFGDKKGASLNQTKENVTFLPLDSDHGGLQTLLADLGDGATPQGVPFF